MSLSCRIVGFSRTPSGKTPPPAPSAAFAKTVRLPHSATHLPPQTRLLTLRSRARELQGEGMIGRYRPPALRALASGGSPLMTFLLPRYSCRWLRLTSTPSRQGSEGRGPGPTLKRVTGCPAVCGYNPSVLPSLSTESFSEQLPASGSEHRVGAPLRPNLRQLAPVASSLRSRCISERNSRLRSGSLTRSPRTAYPTPLAPASSHLRGVVRRRWEFFPGAGTSCALLHRWTLERRFRCPHVRLSRS